MAGMGNFWNNAIINALNGGAAFPSIPANNFIAVFTVTPADTGGGTEVTGGSYARVSVANNTTTWGVATSTGLKTNQIVITFPTASANWGTLVAFGIFDASTVGNLIQWGPLSPSIIINNGQTLSFAVGVLTVSQV